MIKSFTIYREYYEGEELINKVSDVIENNVNIELKTILDTSKSVSYTHLTLPTKA